MCGGKHGVERKLYDAFNRAPADRAVRRDAVCCSRSSAGVGFRKTIRDVANRTLLILPIYVLTRGKVIRRKGSAIFYFH